MLLEGESHVRLVQAKRHSRVLHLASLPELLELLAVLGLVRILSAVAILLEEVVVP